MSAKITITGVSELIAALNSFKARLPQASKKAIETSMSEAEAHSTSIVHVVSGELKASIRSQMKGNDTGQMGSHMEYAAAEERRGGPHQYIRPAYDKVQKSFPEQYLKEIRGVLG